MAMFADLEPRAPDAILGLMERFRADDRPGKVSLASGVYVDESGTTPVLATVRDAEARLLAQQTTKVYKPIAGDPAFLGHVRDLVFGADHPAVASGRIALLHTPGGTGALRVAGDLVHALRPGAAVWLSTPTWPNHPQVFEAVGMPLRGYPYLRADGELDLDAMVSVLRAVLTKWAVDGIARSERRRRWRRADRPYYDHVYYRGEPVYREPAYGEPMYRVESYRYEREPEFHEEPVRAMRPRRDYHEPPGPAERWYHEATREALADEPLGVSLPVHMI